MTNYAIARVFTRIADLMEIQGENPFKIRAYRSAAQTMQELTENLEVLAGRGELQTIPGVGEAIADKTREIIATGTCKLHEKLKAEVPESLIELLNIRGFGTKKIHTVWKELGVTNLDELERAAREHRIRTVPGFSEKSEANLLEAIEGSRRRRERWPIADALPYAEGLLRLFRDTGAFTRIELAGSLRRRQDTVGDVDFVASANDESAALNALAGHSEVAEVLHRGEHEISLCSHNRLRVDVHLVPEGEFAGGWQYYTGSIAHNEDLAARAGAKHPGYFPGADEEAVYGGLDLEMVPPELREGRGEVEAAAEKRLPRLIQAEDIRGILHAHSTWSDGSASIERMAQAARELGYAYHGNTDHSHALSITGGLDPERLRQQMAEIDRLNATFTDGFRVLKGIECDILADGALDLPLELLNELDVVIASVHTHQKQDAETITARVIRALESGVVDILAHPTGRILGVRDPYAVDMDRVMDAAKANKVALEINAFPDRLDLNEVYARQAKDRGIPISVNTDAHKPEHLSLLRYGIWQARRAWLVPGDVINTWPLDRLMDWLHKR